MLTIPKGPKLPFTVEITKDDPTRIQEFEPKPNNIKVRVDDKGKSKRKLVSFKEFVRIHYSKIAV